MKRVGAGLLILLCSGVVLAGEPAPSLAQRYAGEFRFGFGGLNDYEVRRRLLADDPVMTGIVQQQSAILGLNCAYPGVIRPKAGVWNWRNCDQLLDFADAHLPSLPRRAHVPFWPFNPRHNMEWLIRDDSGQPVDRATAVARLREHYLAVMGRYKGRFQYWDVINEVIDPAPPDGLRKGLWKEVIGPELVELAFRFAREADPQARLFYNDYQEWVPARREAIFALVKGLKDKGLVDGIGLQQHVNLKAPTVAEMDQALARFAELGLEIHVTELDVDMNPDGKAGVLTGDMAQRQAQRYRELFAVYRKYAGTVTAVMTWNVTDADSWLRRRPGKPPMVNWPLLFDESGRPKAAHQALLAP